MDLYSIRKQLNMGIPLTSLKLRVTIYSRVSTEHLEQQKSLKNQIEHFEEMIKNNENWTYVKGYTDDGISGTTDLKRDNFMKMLGDAKKGFFDLIVTKEISRFSRNTLDSIKYTRELLSYGVAVLFVNDNINTALPDAELRLTIMASMAQDEIRRLSERVKFGMNRAIKNGTILGNNLLYGYQKDKLSGNLIIVENEAQVIKRLFSLYAINNYSISKIVKIFNEEGIKTCQNKKWCVSTISRMLRNPKYKGYYCGKKTEIVDYMTKKIKVIPATNWILYEDKIRIPAIVDEELWNRANARLLLRKKIFGEDYKNNKIMYQNRYPLSAKIYCAEHNTVFHRRKQCKSSDDITWTCAKYLSEGKKVCNSPNIREMEINYIFNDFIKLLQIDSIHVTNILWEIYENNKYNNCRRLLELRKQKDKIINKKDKLLELNLEGILSNIEFKNKNKVCNKELSNINKEIFYIKCNDKNEYNNLKNILNQEVIDSKITNYLMKLLLQKMIVRKINNNKDYVELKIFFNFSKNFFNREEQMDNLILERKKCFMNKLFQFKRGYNTTCTRRYIMKYQVKAFISIY